MPQLAEIANFKRARTTAPWAEFEPLLHQAIQATNSNQTQVMEAVGYSSGVIAAWRKADKVPLSAKYGMLGLLTELRVSVERPAIKQFTFDELTGLFAALQGWTLPNDTRKALVKRVAREIQND